ncbi:MAG: hypothetical protein ACYCS9_10150 [Candidatus Dormibacteria bacterium]
MPGAEVRLRPSPQERWRAAWSAARVLALLMIPVGVVLALLTGSWGWLLVLEMWALLSAVLSYVGQGQNAVYVGELGVRRITKGCSVTATWSGLEGVEVTIPGQRIVVFQLNGSDYRLDRSGWGSRRNLEALRRNPPDGIKLRLDRRTADTLVTMVREHRPDLSGLADWDRLSRPGGAVGPTSEV